MKKIGQKLSFLTKVLLVVGLLISNLSSLSVVFAYEAPADLVIDLNDSILEINYTKELAEEVEAVDVRVYENYTYLDGKSEEEVVNVYSLTAEEIMSAVEGNLELKYDSIFALVEEQVSNYKLFDGTYSARVEMVDVTVYEVEENDVEPLLEEESAILQTTEIENETNEVVLASSTYEEKITHKSGLNVKLYDLTSNVEINLVNGKYPVSAEASKVEVVAQILAGGLNPTDIFEYAGEEYMASELLEKGFSSEIDFSGRLFGEYEIPVEVKVSKLLPVTEVVSETVEPEAMVEVVTTETDGNYEEVVYADSVSVMYESYEMNAELLNAAVVSEGYGESYLFYGKDADGQLYVLSDFEEEIELLDETVVTGTMLDVYNMLNAAINNKEDAEEFITYTLLKNGENVIESYVPSNEEDTLENYLSTIMLDDTVQVILSNKGLTITYSVVVVGDLNNDNVMTLEDVLELVSQVIGESEITNLEKSDVYGFDGKVDTLDVLYLNQVVRNHVWDAKILEGEVSLDAALDVTLNGEELNEENYLTSGDEFKVDYVLSLTDYEVNGVAGMFNYDKELFELVSVQVNNDWLGNNHDGKFLYLGEESLIGPELEEETENDGTETALSEIELTDEESFEGTLDEESVDYVILTATFRTLKATSEASNNVITLDEIELFNSTDDNVSYYVLDQNTISTEDIMVVASDDNRLSYLEVSGVKIELEENVFEYEINVLNDVTLVDLKYIVNNVAASVTSTILPEELVEGRNEIILTVTSETGVSQDYKIVVIREETEEETVTYVNNYYGDYDNNQKEEVVTSTPEEDDDDEVEVEEESNLSRIVIVILILLVIAGLVYLIFKDDEDEDTKKANKDINKLKKENLESKVEEVSKNTTKVEKKTNNSKSTDNKTKKSYNKKER